MNYEAKKPLGLKWKETKTDGGRGWSSQRKIIEYFNKGLEQQHTRSMDTYADAQVRAQDRSRRQSFADDKIVLCGVVWRSEIEINCN